MPLDGTHNNAVEALCRIFLGREHCPGDYLENYLLAVVGISVKRNLRTAKEHTAYECKGNYGLLGAHRLFRRSQEND